jgi:hypothetical protein
MAWCAVLAFEGGTGTVSKIMWVSNPVITAEDRACRAILSDQSWPEKTLGPASRRLRAAGW